MAKLSWDQLIQALNEQVHIDKESISSAHLNRKVWVSSWSFYGCLPEAFSVSETKEQAIDCALFFTLDEWGSAPRGAKTALKKFGFWEGPAYGSESNCQVTKIEKLQVRELF